MLPFTTDTVTIVHAELVSDSYNNRIRDWPNATRTTVRAVVQGADSAEATDGKDQTDTVYSIYLPAGTAITAQDRLEWDGLVLEVDGEPTLRKGPTRALDHTEITGRLVSG